MSIAPHNTATPRIGRKGRFAAFLLVLSLCAAALPPSAPASFFVGTEPAWFWFRMPERARLLRCVRALPTVYSMRVSGYFGERWSLNGREILPNFLRSGSPAAHLFALEEIISEVDYWKSHPDHALLKNDFSGPWRMRTRLSLPDYLEVCRLENVQPEHYRATAELLADMELSGYAVICDRNHVETGRIGPECTYGSAEPVGISLDPWFMMTTMWYYAEDGIAPPETAPYGVVPMGGGWYRLTP